MRPHAPRASSATHAGVVRVRGARTHNLRGVDADQLYLGKHMLTSALKKVDKAVEDVTRLASKGQLKTGRDYVFNLKNGGVGLGSVNKKVPKADIAKTVAIGEQIAAGKIKVKAKVKF